MRGQQRGGQLRDQQRGSVEWSAEGIHLTSYQPSVHTSFTWEGGIQVVKHPTCSLPDLLQPQSLGAKLLTLSLSNELRVGQHIKASPVSLSTLTTLGHLVYSFNFSGLNRGLDSYYNDVSCYNLLYMYDPQTDSRRFITKNL